MIRYRRKTISANDPPGTRVVHNFPPGRPGRPYADGGFRYWITDEVEQWGGRRCYCGWVDGREHYGTVTAIDANGNPYE